MRLALGLGDPRSSAGHSVFVIPKEHVKNCEDRLVVLNRLAEAIIQLQRGLSSEWVFTYKGAPLRTMNTTA